MKTITVNVTERDIRFGRQSPSAATCPIARALHRHRPFREALVTTIGAVRVVGDDFNVRLPRVAGAFARRIDKGIPVEPFSFEIEVPS